MEQPVMKIMGFSPLQVAKFFIFVAAGLSLLMSVYLYFSGDKQAGIYVGIWVPSILSAGLLLVSRG